LVDIETDLSIEVPVSNRGDNRFRITVYDSFGTPVAEASSEFTIFRSHASAAGIPATHTIAVKVVEVASGDARNELEPLVTKGARTRVEAVPRGEGLARGAARADRLRIIPAR
jgi:hypothetical protein